MKEIFRAVAYPRYSSDNQREESIFAQMAAIEELCKRKGYILVGSYPDEAKSATTDQRPNFQRMMKDSEKGLFEVVIVHKLDRFARDRYDSAYYKRLLRKNGVRLESVLEQLDDSPESVILESVLEGMAEYYSKNLAREARKGMQENAKRSLHTGGRPPYGLKINDEMKYIIDDERAGAVQIYFQGIVGGMSLEQIALTLNDKGFRTQLGRKFTNNSFYGWANNRKYKGDYTWDVSAKKRADGSRNNNDKKPIQEQTIIENSIPAIIAPELWEEVNTIMQKRKQKPGTMKAKLCYLLSGKIICGNCGSVYAGNSYKNPKSKDKTVLTYYKCTGKCGNTSVRKTDIERIALEHVHDVCFSEEAIQEIVQKVAILYREQQNNCGSEKQSIEKKMINLENSINNWIEALGKGIKGLENKIIDAQNRHEALQIELHKINTTEHQTLDISEDFIRNIVTSKKHLLYSAEDADKKEVLQEYVDRVVIMSSKDINNYHTEITYRVFNGGGEGS
jgi:site-specific DNA recombinase